MVNHISLKFEEVLKKKTGWNEHFSMCIPYGPVRQNSKDFFILIGK